MSSERIKRKIVWETSGVSEIIGTILMLSITVVLFSGIITMVGTLPAPKQNFVVDLKCSLHPVNPDNWSAEGVEFRILHQGGQVMDSLWIRIYLAVDNTPLIKTVDDGLVDANGDTMWNVGEYWNVLIGSADVASLDNNSTFSITIVDEERNVLVWQETLGLEAYNYAPIIKRAWIDSDIATAVDDTGPISFVSPFIMYVEVLDPQDNLNRSSVFVDMNSMYKDGRAPTQLTDTFIDEDGIEYGHVDDNIYLAVCNQPNQTNVGYYNFRFFASNNYNITSQVYFPFPVGVIIGENPQIVVDSANIRFSNEQPTNGDQTTITATIQNLGLAGSRVNVTFYMNNKTNMIGNLTILVPMSGERDASMDWLASPGGNHTIIVSAWPLDGTEDPAQTWDNEANKSIIVMPRILLVDDDGHVNDLSEYDTVSYMKGALETADFVYDFVTVGAGDGPGYNYGDYQMLDYDIVIWMTGYRESGTLTLKDVEQLRLYLNGGSATPTGAQGGSLWLISQGFWKEVKMGSAGDAFDTFATQYLEVPTPFLMPNAAPLPANLYGNATNPVTDYFATGPIPTGGNTDVFSWPSMGVVNKDRVALTNMGESDVYAMTYDSDLDLSNPTWDSRRLTQTWGFSRISDTAIQAQYTYKAIMWLGNIEYKFTEDLAISSQTTMPEIVFFKQPVTISFTVRNNGFKVYDPAVDRVEYLLRIYDINSNVIKEVYSYINSTLGIGNNNTVEVNVTWTPQTLGYHRIWIMIDPFNLIPESNKLNNMISNYWGSGELNVRYRILLIDDDDSQNNGGAVTNHNETYDILTSLDYLDYDYELYNVTVNMDGPAFEAGMNGAGLSEYNAVIWVAGEADNPLTGNDRLNITSYTEIGGNFWLISTATENIDSGFLSQYLRVLSVSADQGSGTELTGIEKDPISHGMDYAMTDDPDADHLTPVPGADGFTTDSGDFNSIRYLPTAGISYRAVTTAWLPSNLDDFNQRSEFIFMVLRWFDKPEDRIELRVTDTDITISDDHPQLGSGYVIKVTVQNTGGSTGNVLVRFLDGYTQIGSDSISVSPGGTTTAEIIWVPLFAGQRTIHVILDPVAEVPEIFEWSNNNATRSIYVYFFWDDMESGAGKWSHSSTIMLINGEGPLEYFGSTDVTVNIEKDWDYTESEYIENCTDAGFYHTFDKSFWLQEPAGAGSAMMVRPPLDIVFALDNSASMSNDDMTNLIQATKNFIGQMTDNDRVAIWTYGDSTYDYPYDQDTAGDVDPYMLEDWEYMTAANRNAFNTSLDTLDNVMYGTPFYDTLGEAVRTALEGDPDASDPTRLEYVIGMTDGDSNDDEAWTPNRNWGTVGYETDYGDDKDKQGLLYAPCMIYTVGLGIDHDDGDGGWIYPTAPDWSHIPPHDGSPAGEYDLWHVADTSPFPTHDAGGVYGENATTGDDNIGHYYYTTDSSQLPSIFDEIFQSIGGGTLEGEDQTRSSPSGPSPNAVTSYTFSGVTVAGGPHDAWFCDVDDSSSANLINPNSAPEFTDAQYVQAATVDGNRAQSLDPGNWDEVFVKTRFSISEAPSTISQIDLRFVIQGNAGTDFEIYAYNIVSGAYEQIGTPSGWTNGDTDADFTRSITVNCDQYVSVAGDLYWGCYQTDSSDLVRVNFAEVTITSSSSPTITSTSPADGVIDVPLNEDIVITFSQQMEPTTLAWSITPSVGVWTETWSAGDTVVTLSHATNFAQSQMYEVEVTACSDTAFPPQSLTPGLIPNPWSFITTGPAVISSTTPADAETDVLLNQDIIIDFSKVMNPASLVYSCVPNPGGWAVNWAPGNTQVTLSHALFASLTSYTFTVSQARDMGGVNIVAGPVPNPWHFTTVQDNPPSIISTTPANGAINVPLAQDITITFTEPMITGSVTYSINPIPGAPVATWSAGNTVLTLNYPDYAIDTAYRVEVLTGTDTSGNSLIGGSAPNPWGFHTLDLTPPTITLTTPSDGSTGVGTGQPIIITFSEAMDTASVQAAFACLPNPGGWTFVWNSLKTEMTARHYDFSQLTSYTCALSNAAEDISGNSLTSGAKPNPWSFTTGVGGGSGSTPGLSPDGTNTNKSAVTKSMDLRNLDKATIEFWHKYNLVPGANGGVLLLGFFNETASEWQYRYVVPSSAYTGNLRLNVTDRVDSFGTYIQWGWNGISGRGTFAWEKVSLDMLSYLRDLPPAWLDQVRVKFQYYQYGGGTGYGWYIDDVRVTVARSNSMVPDATCQDLWYLTNAQAHSGNYSWGNVDPVTGLMKPGIDNYLMTNPIDLTNAKTAYLSAYVKFNFNFASGAPPDGFRVEISKDNGVTWTAVNLGVRSAWNISGTGFDADDGYPTDGKSYTGINDGNYWVSLGSLTRVNVDLSSFSGNAIHIRFRVITNSDAGYEHSNNALQGDPGFGGFFVDDVLVTGETILTG